MAIAGKRARNTARQRTGSRSGVPWPGRGVGWLAGIGCCRRGPCWRCCGRWCADHRAAPGRRSPANGPGQRRDSTPEADWAWCSLVVVSGGWQASVAGMCSCWRRRSSANWRYCGRWRAAHRAAPGRRSPASGARATARRHTGSRSGVPWLGQDLGVLDHRQFGRFFVLSIGEA